MTHEEALNLMLAHACPATSDEKTGICEFVIETHCVEFKVKARLVSTYKTIQYEILSCEIN